MKRALALLATAAACLVALAACTVDGPSNGPAEQTTIAYESVQGPVRVFAASSLSSAFGELEAAFEQINPGIDVEVNFGASSALREQILDGAPADVFASANTAVMAELVNKDQAFGAVSNFASNQLVLVASTSSDNSASGEVQGIVSLRDETLLVGICAPQVPCGQLAQTVLADRGVQPNVDTYEPNVRALTNRVIDGELDVGLVYATDAEAAGDQLRVVEQFADSTSSYPIAARTRAGQLFVDYVTSEAGQTVLASWGFGTP